jgi:glycosyltransferase involved in cell wall biosynthesis
VIIPAYNAEPFIEETLQSVLSQTYQALEVLVVDDGSSDRTPEIVERYAQQDARIKLLRQTNQGVAAARNLAIAHSTGDYIAPIDADDIWYPTKLEKQVQAITQSNAIGLVYTWSVLIDEHGLPFNTKKGCTKEGDIYLDLLLGNFVDNGSNPMIRKECIQRVGGYDPQFRRVNAQGCEDWDLYLRIAEDYKYRVIPEFLTGYRQTLISMSSNVDVMMRSYELVMAAARQRKPGVPESIYRLSGSHYCIYLAIKSQQMGKHGDCLKWAYQALRFDIATLKHYRLLFILLKLIAYPVTSLIWPDHFSWIRFRETFKSRFGLRRQVPFDVENN